MKKISTVQVFGNEIFKEAAKSHRTGDRNTFAMGKPAVKGAGTRSDRGARTKSAIDHQEQSKRRSTRCANPGTTGAHRSRAIGAGAASQCKGANPSDDNPGASRTGECSNGLGERGTGVGEVLW